MSVVGDTGIGWTAPSLILLLITSQLQEDFFLILLLFVCIALDLTDTVLLALTLYCPTSHLVCREAHLDPCGGPTLLQLVLGDQILDMDYGYIQDSQYQITEFKLFTLVF